MSRFFLDKVTFSAVQNDAKYAFLKVVDTIFGTEQVILHLHFRHKRALLERSGDYRTRGFLTSPKTERRTGALNVVRFYVNCFTILLARNQHIDKRPSFYKETNRCHATIS